MKGTLFSLALLHVLTSLAAVASVYLALASFGGGSDSAFAALCMLFAWFVGGLLAARKLRFGLGTAAAVSAAWAAVSCAADLAVQSNLFTLPQFVTGIGLAYMLPVDQHSAWFFETLKPTVGVAAHVLLPLCFVLGVFAGKLYENNKS